MTPTDTDTSPPPPAYTPFDMAAYAEMQQAQPGGSQAPAPQTQSARAASIPSASAGAVRLGQPTNTGPASSAQPWAAQSGQPGRPSQPGGQTGGPQSPAFVQPTQQQGYQQQQQQGYQPAQQQGYQPAQQPRSSSLGASSVPTQPGAFQTQPTISTAGASTVGASGLALHQPQPTRTVPVSPGGSSLGAGPLSQVPAEDPPAFSDEQTQADWIAVPPPKRNPPGVRIQSPFVPGQEAPPTYTPPAYGSHVGRVVQAQLGDVAQVVTCPHCYANVVTRVEHVWGRHASIMAGIGAAYFYLGGCLWPLCCDSMRDAQHVCPNCSNVIGTYRRM